MIAAVADTHVVLWFLAKDPRLSSVARNFIRRTQAEGDIVGVSSVSLVEIVYLVEKGRIPDWAYDQVLQLLAQGNSVFREVELTTGIASAMRQVARADVPDMPDRIIAATGVYLGVPILSRDGKIRAAGLETIW